jgi:hypothetical protein
LRSHVLERDLEPHAGGRGRFDLYAQVGGGRPARTGTVATRGNRVILSDASGSELSLVSSGDTLYGITKDNANGRATMINLEKQ